MSANPDLVSAAVARLRAWDSGAFAAAVGDTAAAPKIWSDAAMGDPDPPWVVVTEIAELLDVESEAEDGTISYFGRGEIQVGAFAAGKAQARALRNQAVSALADADLAFDEGTLLEFRPASLASPAQPGVGPDGNPALYCGVATFLYRVRRTF